MYSIWLTFDIISQKRLRRTIASLAHEFGGPNFEPHCTIVGETNLTASQIAVTCERLCRGLHQQQIEVSGLAGDLGYYMALFLQLSLPQKLTDLQLDLARELDVDPSCIPASHVSLAYSERNLMTQLNGLNSHIADLLGQHVLVCKQVEVVRSSRTIPVREWETLYTLPLLEH